MQRLDRRIATLEARMGWPIDLTTSTDAELLDYIGWRLDRAPTDSELQALADQRKVDDHAQVT